MLQHRTSLLYGDAGEPSDEVRQLCPVFKVLKEGGYRHAGAAKTPCAADLLGVSINGWTGRPIVHVVILGSKEAGFNMEANEEPRETVSLEITSNSLNLVEE